MKKKFLRLVNAHKGVSKDAAFAHLNQLIDAALADSTSPTINITDLVPIYAHLLPKRPTGVLTGLDWVSLAINPKDICEYLHYIYADGQNVVATDRHRLHLQPSNLPPGFYCPKSRLKLYEIGDKTFPRYARVIPEHTDLTGYTPKELALDHGSVAEGSRTIPTVILTTPCGKRVALNRVFYQDALRNASADADSVQVYIQSATHAVKIVNTEQDTTAIVMPIRDK